MKDSEEMRLAKSSSRDIVLKVYRSIIRGAVIDDISDNISAVEYR